MPHTPAALNAAMRRALVGAALILPETKLPEAQVFAADDSSSFHKCGQGISITFYATGWAEVDWPSRTEPDPDKAVAFAGALKQASLAARMFGYYLATGPDREA